MVRIPYRLIPPLAIRLSPDLHNVRFAIWTKKALNYESISNRRNHDENRSRKNSIKSVYLDRIETIPVGCDLFTARRERKRMGDPLRSQPGSNR